MTFVQPQLIPIPFTGGVDTKTDSHQTLAGKLLGLENGQFTKQGQINKRSGYRVFGVNIEGSNSVISSAQALDSYNEECLLFDGLNVFSYVNTTTNWINRGTAVSIVTRDKQIARTNVAQMLNPDIAVSNGMEVYAWEDSRGGVRYSVLDASTKSFCVADTQLNATAVKPKCVVFNNLIYTFYSDGNNNLYYQTINPFNPTVVTNKVNVVTDGYSGMSYDVATIGSKLFVTYLSTATASGRINLFNYDSTLTKSSVINVESTAGRAINTGFQGCLNVVGDSTNNVWVSWGDGVTVRCAAYSFTMMALLASTAVATARAQAITGIESTTPNVLQLTYEVFNSTAFNARIQSSTVTLGAVVTSTATQRSVGLASKAFKQNGNIYVNATIESTDQSTYWTLLLNGTSFTTVAKAQQSVGGGLRTNRMLSETCLASTGIFQYANLVKGPIVSEGQTIFSLLGVNSTTLDYQNPNKFLSVTQSNNLLIVGGFLQCYDGVSVVEHGFHIYPENVTATAAGSDGYLSSGTYQYQVCYEWTDNFGQIQRSAPSPTVTVSVSLNNHVTLTIPTLRLTAKQGKRSAPSVVVYRTQVNGSNFNRATSTIAPLLNDPTTDTVTFVDVVSDSSILSNALIYTSGDVLNNISPPANSLISLYQNRVILGGLEDPNLLWYSQNKFDNTNFSTTPAEFCAELTIGCDPRGGPITALGLLDSNLIIFKRNAMFVLQGDGPNAAGTGDTFPDPQMISSDVGCNNPNSVVIMPNGLMFQSDKGIYLLDRQQNVQYIGAPVEDFTSAAITSATLVPDANQVIFTIANTLPGGPALVYDYYFGQWSTFTNHYAEDSVVFQDAFCFVKANGHLYQQDAEAFTDGGAPIIMTWISPNLSFAQLNGFQQVFRVFLLGTYKGPHKLQVSVAYDYNNTYTETVTVNASQNVTTWGSDPTWGSSSPWGGAYTPYEFRIDFKTQRCTAIRLKVSDSQASDYNEGYSISAMTFEVGALPGGNRLPSSGTYGTR